MFCPKCGKESGAGAQFCDQCGARFSGPPVPVSAVEPPPSAVIREVPNYLVPAILCTIFCCLPFGVVAIVYASQVNGKLQAGDSRGAMQSSKNARTWCWVSFASGLISIVSWAIYAFSIGLFARFLE